jgi:hypothetical protein
MRGGERASATPARAVRRTGEGARRPEPLAPRIIGLAETQRALMAGISGSEADAEVASYLVMEGPRSSARDRLDVYRVGYRARLVECLLDDYPVLAECLGEERFEQLCLAYMERHPSSSPNLNPFGRHMPFFCKTLDAETAGAVLGTDEARDFWSELATLEWTLVETIHAAPSPPFDLAALQAVPEARLAHTRLTRSECVRMLRFQHPVNAFYQARRRGEAVAIPEPGPSATAVYRKGFTLWRMDLTPAMARVLDALLGGCSIGESLARIGVDESEPAALAEAERSVMIWFREWVQAGFFTGVEPA